MKTPREESRGDLEPGQELEIPARDQFDEAEELLRLIADEPDVPSHVVRLADLYAQRGRQDLAIACTHQAVAANPEDPRLLRILGRTLEAAGETDLARDAYLAAVAVGANPRHPQPWLGLARLERAWGRLALAEQYARCALDVAPDLAEVYAELARILLQDSRVNQAFTLLARGLQWAPDDRDLLDLRERTQAAPPSDSAPGQGQEEAPSTDLG
jgi:tetratricopeptide (TPR) repeat protein